MAIRGQKLVQDGIEKFALRLWKKYRKHLANTYVGDLLQHRRFQVPRDSAFEKILRKTFDFDQFCTLAEIEDESDMTRLLFFGSPPFCKVWVEPLRLVFHNTLLDHGLIAALRPHTNSSYAMVVQL